MIKKFSAPALEESPLSKQDPSDRIIALAGNPNVGKSTVFNALTGMKQHTGNWAGKTVGSAYGEYLYQDTRFILADLPGAYSLLARSAEEAVARDFLCFARPDAVVIVCDATCLERNLNLALQIIESGQNTIICVNLLDEALHKGITINLEKLSQLLGVPVLGTSARCGRGLAELQQLIAQKTALRQTDPPLLAYPPAVEAAIALIEPHLAELLPPPLPPRWLALRLLENEPQLLNTLEQHSRCQLADCPHLQAALEQARQLLAQQQITAELLQDQVVGSIVRQAEQLTNQVITLKNRAYDQTDRRLDQLLTSRATGIPIMLALLVLVFWLTISGANYPSQWLAQGFAALEHSILQGLAALHSPPWLTEALVSGVYKTLTWVVAVMLPPMAIFFPLFTLLEDSGYLPRIAFNLDKYFQKACACGKQALTMCMGCGCNAAGVTGCRIIDSPRERLIAILTNTFMPCNGRFPTLIALISIFFIGGVSGAGRSLLATLGLTGLIVLAVLTTLAVSRLLSKTLLRGVPSSFTLELPPYRKPQIGRVIINSVRDRTLFVLARAALVAAPAGLLIWILANIYWGDLSLLAHCASFLDPFARLLGLDGVILFAFILGFPANEIVLPIILMAYLAQGSLSEIPSLGELHTLLTANGWTWLTALCVMLFSLMHFPCSTTCLTIKKETGSWKWTFLALTIPTACGLALCLAVTTVVRLLGLG